jgi:cytoplasmic tRNA 2-thiolation protein 1
MVKICVLCQDRRAVLKRPKTGQQICKECFFYVFETEIHHTIQDTNLFQRGERVAIGASGGKGIDLERNDCCTKMMSI